MDAITSEEVKKKLMLERFQDEVRAYAGPCVYSDNTSRTGMQADTEPSPTRPSPTTPTQNPGFDFSNAQFNGSVPDPQTFMGGVKY